MSLGALCSGYRTQCISDLTLPERTRWGPWLGDHPFQEGSVLVFVPHLVEHRPRHTMGSSTQIIIIGTPRIIGQMQRKIPVGMMCGGFPSCWLQLENFVSWLTNNSQAEAEQEHWVREREVTFWIWFNYHRPLK